MHEISIRAFWLDDFENSGFFKTNSTRNAAHLIEAKLFVFNNIQKQGTDVQYLFSLFHLNFQAIKIKLSVSVVW